jgi:hypothetical protein
VIFVWRGVAAVLLVVTAGAHASTFLGIDPMEQWPGVMFLHLAIFPVFGAALYYATRAVRGSKNLDPVFNGAPRGLRGVAGGLFVYALVNFGLFMVLNEGGQPHFRDGKYVLTSHGKVIRELTEAEFHRHQAYVVRGFSGHWMFFAAGSLTLLVGAVRHRRVAGWEPDAEPPAAATDRGTFYLED